jgi:cell division septum initiation protein DivIVA
MHHPGFDIRSHAFTRAVRGVDEAEVEAALEAATPAYEEARAILQELEQTLAEALAERDRLIEGERSVIKLIRSAEEHARVRIGTAHRDAARIVERAEGQARELLTGADAQRTTLLRDIEAIERRRHHLVTTVSDFVETMASKPSTALVPDALTTLPQAAGDEVWAPLVEQEQEEFASSSSWTAEMDDAGPDDALAECSSPTPEHDAANASVDVEPVPESTSAWSADDGSGSRRWWPRLATRHALAGAAAVVMLAAAIASPAVRGWSGRSAATSRSGAGSPPVLAAGFVPEPAPALETGQASQSPTVLPAPNDPFVDAAPVAPLAIKLTTTRSCWVGVTIDGHSDSVLLEPGDELERSGTKQIRLRIGDAGAATLVVNGPPQPPLGRNGQVVDRTFSVDDHQ